MQSAEPRKLGLAEAGYSPEDPHLLAVLQLGLEPHHVEQTAKLIVLAQLHHRIRFDVWLMRIGEAERLHRSMAQRFASALGHHFDRQAAVEIRRCGLEIVKRNFVAGVKRVDKGVVLRARQRTIDVIGARAAGAGLVVARLKPRDVEVDRVAVDDRRNGIEERQRVFAGELRIVSASAGEVSGPVATDDVVPLRRRLGDFRPVDLDERLGFQRRGDRGGESVAIDGERAAGRQLVEIGRAHHQRVEPAHLGMQKADRAALSVIGAERIGTNQLGKVSGLVHGSRARRAHFVQHNRDAAARELPGGLGTR